MTGLQIRWPSFERALVLIALGSVWTGCASPNVHKENRELIAAMAPAALSGDVGEVEGPLQSVILRTNEEPAGFHKQRMFAAYLLSRAFMETSSTQPTDWLSPSMRSLTYAAYGADWERAAKAEGKAAKSGEPLLPPELEEFGVERVRQFRDVCWFVTCMRSSFQTEGRRVLEERLPEWRSYTAAVQACDELGVSRALRSWVYWSLFDALRRERRTETEAFKFGIAARQISKADRSSGAVGLPQGVEDRIVRWIQEDSSYVFVGDDDELFNPAFESVGSVRNIDLLGELREDYERRTSGR